MNAIKKVVASASSMAFINHDGLVETWQQAMKFAGKDGRLATMPDIVAARLAADDGDGPWDIYYTTLTAEYYGISKSGKRILIIAHGIGPMSTLDGVLKAYSWEYKDKTRQNRGGRITQEEFLDLEAGKYGAVEIIGLEEYCQRYKFPFRQILKLSEALTDPVLKARLGSRAEEYIQAHAKHSRLFHREKAGVGADDQYLSAYVVENKFHDNGCRNIHFQHIVDGAMDSNPFIISVNGPNNCCYFFGTEHGFRKIEDGYAIAHLISTGRYSNTHHEGNSSLTLDVGCHEWNNGTRLVGIKNTANDVEVKIKTGPNAHDLLRKHWRDLLMPIFPLDIAPIGFRALVKIDEQLFTQYPKMGAGMDTHEPEYVVKSIEEIGEPVLFRTEIVGYHGFFKFDTKDVQAIAPPTANAYFFVSETQNEWMDGNPTHQTAMVQFYRIEADISKRLIRADQLSHDYDKMMALLEK